ncbi:MAG TPA: AAA family ATPase, partial [Actinophytocola sp.]|nr:AAA family ATPase [Actinophytocola sp.]
MTTAELIGRDHPAGMLRAEIDRAADSHGGLVLVTGEAGIGKTTLVTAAAETARRAGALVLSGSCWDSDAAPGYWPWVQVLRGLRRHATGEEWAAAEQAGGPTLPFLLGETATTEPAEGFQLYDAVTSALVAVAQRRAVIVVLDDLHWADPESVRLLEFVAQHTWFERLLLVGTYRDVEVEAADHPLAPVLLPLLARATTVTLTGLDQDEVGALITRTTGTAAADELVAEVHLRTGGNPFFVEQTARLWHSGSALTTVAPGVRDAVRRRLSLLPAMVSTLLTDAAVLGREFHRQVLAATVGAPVPQVDRLLDEAIAARLVLARGDGRFSFAHDLVRETLYEELGEDAARGRHAAVVRALDRSAVLAERIFPADRARHAYLAGPELDPGVVVDHLMAAAKEARRRMSSEELIGHLRRALEFAPAQDPRRVRITLDLGQQYRHLGRSAEASANFQEAADLALGLDDPEPLTRVALTLYGYAGRVKGELTERTVRAVHARLIGDGADAEPAAEKSLDRLAQEVILHVILHARNDNDDDTLGFSLWTKHDTLWSPGNAAERQALTDELVIVARRTGDVEMEMYATSLGWVAALEQGHPSYDERFTAFVTMAERHEVESMRLGALIDQSIIAAVRGRFAEAEAMLDQALNLPAKEEIDAFSYMGHQLRWSLMVLQGRFAEVADIERRSIEVKYPHPALLAGITAATRGDGETARRYLAEVEAGPEPLTGPFQPMQMRLQAHVGALTKDPELCARARAVLTPLVGRWLVSLYGCDIAGPAALWLAKVDLAQSDWDAAVSGFTEALRSAEQLGARTWVVEAKLGLADALAGRGSTSDALRADAHREAAELGIRHHAADGAAEPAPPAATNEFRYTGEVWSLTMSGHTVHVPDAKGLRDLHVLLSSPGRDIPATTLLNPAGGAEVVAATGLGADDVLDAEARAAYRRRLTQLDELIDSATSRGDDTRAAAYDRERETLLTELRAAAGLGPRQRRLGDEAERARKTVTARIRDTL